MATPAGIAGFVGQPPIRSLMTRGSLAKLAFELVPTAASGNTLAVLYRNKPLPKVEVTVNDP